MVAPYYENEVQETVKSVLTKVNALVNDLCECKGILLYTSFMLVLLGGILVPIQHLSFFMFMNFVFLAVIYLDEHYTVSLKFFKKKETSDKTHFNSIPGNIASHIGLYGFTRAGTCKKKETSLIKKIDKYIEEKPPKKIVVIDRTPTSESESESVDLVNEVNEEENSEEKEKIEK